MNVNVGPMAVLVLGVLLAVGGVSAGMNAATPAEKFGAALPGVIVIGIALVMNFRQQRAVARGKGRKRDGGDVNER